MFLFSGESGDQGSCGAKRLLLEEFDPKNQTGRHSGAVINTIAWVQIWLGTFLGAVLTFSLHLCSFLQGTYVCVTEWYVCVL